MTTAASTRRMKSPPAVAEELGVSPETVIGWIRSKQLRAIDVSSRPGIGRPRFRIDPADLAAFEASREVGGAKAPRRRKRRQTGITQYF